MSKKRIFRMTVLLLLFAVWGACLLTSCSSTRNLCPAYDSKYKVEPLPY